MTDSTYGRFLERQETTHKPRPGLWFFVAVAWVLIGVGGVVVIAVPHGHDRDVVLSVIFIIGAAVNVPLALWRRRRDQLRRSTWSRPV
jgi:drug/metabolite transporter (DMT)-like permease